MNPRSCDEKRGARRELVYGEARIIRLGGPFVSAHLLVDREGLTLIDTGLWGVARRLRRVMAELGRRPEELGNIVLTHGHIDHVGGAAEIQERTGARVWAHPADREHVEQRVRYSGAARVCGGLERAARAKMAFGAWISGRGAKGYRAPRIGGELRDGEVLPFWGGLRVWHLPGHTPGHCALVAERAEASGLIFSGDLFASYAGATHAAPRILSRDVAEARRSLAKLAEARPAAVVPSHYDRFEPALHARRLRRLVSQRAGPTGR